MGFSCPSFIFCFVLLGLGGKPSREIVFRNGPRPGFFFGKEHRGQERRADKAEASQSELQAEVLRLRGACEEARAEAEAARALAEQQRRSAPPVRDAPKESLAPMADKAGGGGSAFGKYQAKVSALEAECATLRGQLASAQAAGSPSKAKGPALRR